jgi:oligopeptide/dipeptide ABC transporter ATP-binding protein
MVDTGMDTLMQVRDLDIRFPTADGVAHAVRGLDVDIRRGDVHALVGESGSGKTVASRAMMGVLHSPPAEIRSGSVLFGGNDVLAMKAEARRRMRGSFMGMIFQEPGKYLNPSLTVQRQIVESLTLHKRMTPESALERARELMQHVGLAPADRILHSYAHELSGGMKQRAMIAMAIACDPAFLIADEPTTALDVTIQDQILRLLLRLKEELDMTVLFISHDMAVVGVVANRVSVIYAGKIVETAPARQLFFRPLHPYTKLLLASIPDPSKRGTRLKAVPGRIPDPRAVPPGCAFHPRCPFAEAECSAQVPALVEHEPEHSAACRFIGRKELAV